MIETPSLRSKVLVLDDAAPAAALRGLCEQHQLTGLRAHADTLSAVLQSNVDLGAVLLAEHDTRGHRTGAALARVIHAQRPELPIFLRREHQPVLDDLPAEEQALFSAAYTLQDGQALAAAVERWIFDRVYPPTLVRGIGEMSKLALESQLIDFRVEAEPPHVVRDRIIYGELFTLIPLEAQWCRGTMTLQAKEQELLALVREGRTHADPEAAHLRTVNHVFGEITNLIWGAFRNRFVAYKDFTGHMAQVPIVVNHEQRYISFGSEDPQLCFRYTLVDTREPARPPVTVVQRFIFNLSWQPEDFHENRESLDALVEAGELELF